MSGTDDRGDEFPDEGEPGSRQELEALLMGGAVPKDPDTGAVVRGTVVQISDDEVFVDVGAKSEAVISTDELVNAEGVLEVKVGDAIEASVVSTSDGIRLSRRMLKSAKSREGLLDAHRAGIPVEGRVDAVRKGGFDVILPGNTRAFCPLSQIDERRVENPQEWVGRTLEFRILEMDPRARNVVVSRRRLLEEVASKKAEETRARIKEGMVMTGRVASLQSYGAFIDIDGVQGLLHVSEIAHSRVGNPSEVLKPGDEVKVKVIKLDAESGKVSLSMKALEEDPWLTVAERVRAGERVKGRVVRVAEFGAFVELVPGIEGLLHVSEVAPGKRSGDARHHIEPGETVLVKVLEVDADARRISLARVEEGEEDVVVEPGAMVSGRVERVEPFGLIVRLGPGVSGLVPNEELGLGRGDDARRLFEPGTELNLEVIDVEEGGRRVRLSRIRAMARAERDELSRFRQGAGGDRGFSTLGDAFRRKPRGRGRDQDEDED